MNINELFEEIQNEFVPEELNGEFTLHKNYIIWSFDLAENTGESDNYDYDEDNHFNYEALSSTELQLEAYQVDLEKLQDFLDRIEEYDNWDLSDTETIDEIISFKIN